MILYCAVNPFMPGFCKIGISNDVPERLKELYGQWEAVQTWDNQTFETETAIKHRMKPFAVHGHELFNCPVSYLIQTVETVLNGYQTIELPEAVTVAGSMKAIGCLIREARKRQGLTQSEVAGACGCGLRFIVESEAGKPTCEIEKVLHVCRMLGIKLFFHLSG